MNKYKKGWNEVNQGKRYYEVKGIYNIDWLRVAAIIVVILVIGLIGTLELRDFGVIMN